MTAFSINTEGDVSTLEISTQIYCQEAINSAVYKFTNKYHIHIDEMGPDRRIVKMKPKSLEETAKTDVEHDMGELMNEILDQQLRIQLAGQNGHIRDLIVAHAFSPIPDLKGKLGE